MSPAALSELVGKHVADPQIQPRPALSLTTARMEVDQINVVHTVVTIDSDTILADASTTGGVEAFGVQLFAANFRMNVLASRIKGSYRIDGSDSNGGEIGLGTTVANADTGATADFGAVGTQFETILEGGAPALGAVGVGDTNPITAADGYRGRIGTGTATSHNVCLNMVCDFADPDGTLTILEGTQIDIWHLPLNLTSET